MIVIIDDAEYDRGIDANRYSVIGRLHMQKGGPMVNTLGLKTKLASIWDLHSFRITPIGKAYYYIRLHSMGDQSKVMSLGAVNLRQAYSGLRVGFNSEVQKQSNV